VTDTLARALAELDERKRELDHLNSELFDTNRGVLALYAELDEKAEHLQRADDLKTRFLSNMSHEFRTPLNSILALSQLLASQVDGPLSREQHKQVGYIRQSATELLDMVNDLLDLAKVESGKIALRMAEFAIDDLFAALRGMLRPMINSSRVELIFDSAASLPRLFSDEAKVMQILRNFIGNALKFTERGEIRVSANLLATGQWPPGLARACEHESIIVSVADTGIGIAAGDCERIFEEFSQVENALQQRVKGTGLGLPLCRKLAAILGGHIWVESELGIGSRFHLLVPRGEPVNPRDTL
jgi:signal transduction histidine kinase